MSDPCWPSTVLDPHMIVSSTIRDWLVLHDFDSATPEEVKMEAAEIGWGLSRAIPTQVACQYRPDDVWRCHAVIAFDGRYLTWRVTGEEAEEEWIGSTDIIALIEGCL